MMMMKPISLVLACTASFAVPAAHAALTLTAEGIAAGFTLSTFVSGYNFGGSYGPLAQGIDASGHVITGSMGDHRIYVFKDVDGQALGDALSSTSYSCETGNCNWAMATAGGKVYGAQLFGGIYNSFAGNGSFSPIPNLTAAGLRGYLGMWGNPVNGHLIAAANVGLVDIDPVAGSYRTVVANLFPDGVSVSPDGTTAYVEKGGTIQSYNLGTGALGHTYFTGHSPDGTGVITGGALDGDVVVNNNDGTVGLLDPSKADGDPLQFTIIARGGTRGDFVSPDTTNGTLFLSQNERVDRLSCGPGCSIGTPPVPEPDTYALMLGGMVVAGLLARKRR